MTESEFTEESLSLAHSGPSKQRLKRLGNKGILIHLHPLGRLLVYPLKKALFLLNRAKESLKRQQGVAPGNGEGLSGSGGCEEETPRL